MTVYFKQGKGYRVRVRVGKTRRERFFSTAKATREETARIKKKAEELEAKWLEDRLVHDNTHARTNTGVKYVTYKLVNGYPTLSVVKKSKPEFAKFVRVYRADYRERWRECIKAMAEAGLIPAEGRLFDKLMKAVPRPPSEIVDAWAKDSAAGNSPTTKQAKGLNVRRRIKPALKPTGTKWHIYRRCKSNAEAEASCKALQKTPGIYEYDVR